MFAEWPSMGECDSVAGLSAGSELEGVPTGLTGKVVTASVTRQHSKPGRYDAWGAGEQQREQQSNL